MAYSIDLTAALKVNMQDNRSKPADFASSSTEKGHSFRDSLKEAVSDRGMDKRRSENDTALRRDMISRSEVKLKTVKKPEQKNDESDKPVEESNEMQLAEVKKAMDEILSKLEELSQLQMAGQVPVEKQAVLLEGIKEALKELAEVKGSGRIVEIPELQTKTSGLAEQLKEMLNSLEVNGSMEEKEASLEFTKELKSVVSEITSKLEAEVKPQITNTTAEPVLKKESNTAAEATVKAVVKNDHENTAATNTQGKTDTADKKSKSSVEAQETQSTEVKAERPAGDSKPISKEVQPAAEETNEEVKSALEGKVERVTVEAKESRKQDAEAENGREPAPQPAKAAVNSQQMQVNEKAFAINTEQIETTGKAEVVQTQAPVTKADIPSRAEVINQIVKKAEILMTDAKQEMRMQLEPENLGKLTLKLAVEKGLITAKFVAESYEVKQVIESNFNELKDMLQEKGLEVQNFSVSVGQENKEFGNGDAFQQWKETVKLNGRSLNKSGYDGYQTDEAASVKVVNPYSIHNGKFDHKA